MTVLTPWLLPTGVAGRPAPESYVTLGSDTTYFQTHPAEDRHLEAHVLVCGKHRRDDLSAEVPVTEF